MLLKHGLLKNGNTIEKLVLGCAMAQAVSMNLKKLAGNC